MRSILCLAMFSLIPCTIHAQKVCHSCIERQRSHQDDLSRVGYYEDTEYFKNNQENTLQNSEDSSYENKPVEQKAINKKKIQKNS